VTTAAVVLAAGGGTRYRRSGGEGHKLLVSLWDRPVVAHAMAQAVAAGLDATYVVQGAVELPIPPGVDIELVHNPAWADGIATSVQAAIATAREAGHDAVVVGLGDQPLVSPEAWRRVAAESARPITVATYDGRRGNPVRLAADIWPLLPTTGDEGARALMRRSPDLVAEVACPGDSADLDVVADLHDLRDLASR
jgi:molybdenum cofactor cytidylyltransferase